MCVRRCDNSRQKVVGTTGGQIRKRRTNGMSMRSCGRFLCRRLEGHRKRSRRAPTSGKIARKWGCVRSDLGLGLGNESGCCWWESATERCSWSGNSSAEDGSYKPRLEGKRPLQNERDGNWMRCLGRGRHWISVLLAGESRMNQKIKQIITFQQTIMELLEVLAGSFVPSFE